MNLPSMEVFDDFQRKVESERESRDARFRERIFGLSGISDAANSDIGCIGLDLRIPEEREIVERALLEEKQLINQILNKDDYIHWLYSDPAFQIVTGKVGLVSLDESETRKGISTLLDRIVRRANAITAESMARRSRYWEERQPSADDIEDSRKRNASVTTIPYSVERWFLQPSEWLADIGIAIKHYLDGTGVQATFEISEQVQKAKSGLQAFIEATDSDAARYYGLLFGRNPGSGYPLNNRQSNLSRLVELQFAQLQAMEDEIEQLRVVKRRDVFSPERVFISELFHCNYRTWGKGIKRSVRTFADARFIENAIEDKTIDRVYGLVKKQMAAISAIRQSGGNEQRQYYRK